MQKQYINSLTSLRFFAAFAIVLHHTRGMVFQPNFLEGVPLAAGVSFFFVLSGFILAYVYANTFKTVGFYKFLSARIARIWPAHMFVFLLTIVLFPLAMLTHGVRPQFLPGILNATLLQSLVPVPAYYFSFNNVSWSISTEAIFYILFPALIISIGRTWHIKTILLLVAGFIPAYLLDRYNVNYYSPDQLKIFSGHGIAYINPIARIQEFYIGILFYFVSCSARDNRFFGKIQCTFLEISCVIGMFILVPFIIEKSYALVGAGKPAQAEYVSHVAAGILFGIIILIFSLNRGVISQILSLRIFVVLGEISFSIYMIHYVVFIFYTRYKSIFSALPSSVIFCLLFGVICLIAYCMWRWIEIPSNRKLKSFFAKLNFSRPRSSLP